MLEQSSSESLYREIVTNMLEGVMVISMNGKIDMINPAAEKILGLTQEDVGSVYGSIFLVREGTDDFNEVIFNTIYEKGKVSNMPVDYLLDGETRNLSLTTSYIHTGGAKSVVVVIEDVTELNELRDARVALERIKVLNAEYEKARNEAILANEAKSLFLSNMSHEIRTPINAVLGMNEMILRECSDEQLLSYAANIQSSGKTLLFLINDILDMSKIESGKMEIVPAEYEPADLMLDLWNVIYLRAQQKDLAISFIVDETLPKVLYGDDVRIKQIVTNLLTNAVKYTPAGSVEMHVSYDKLTGDMISLTIAVKDTGMGIKQEDMGKLFESFQRLDEDKNRRIEGTGLGMNITMSLLKMMDGDMKVDSVYQEGSTFTVTIPQKVVSSEPTGDFETIQNRNRQAKAGAQETYEAPEANILVVDDNAMNLTVFKALLKRTKMNITTADTGMKCLELVQNQPFHIIFMDHMMPDMDGVETLHRIQQLSDFPNEKTPVIVLTANAIAGAKEMYISEGFTDFFTKPIDGDKLEQMIAEYLPEELIHKTDSSEQKTQEEDGKGGYKRYMEYGISIEHGLSYAKGSLDIYLDLLDMFQNDNNLQGRLLQLISEQNMHDYGIQVHGLKGNARTLGADRLADIAFEHEKQGKAGNIDYVKEHWEELAEALKTAHEGFGEFLWDNGVKQPEGNVLSDSSGEILDLSQDELTEVAALIDNFETEKAVAQLKEWMQSPLKPDVCERIKGALAAIEREFDEDKAIEILNNN